MTATSTRPRKRTPNGNTDHAARWRKMIIGLRRAGCSHQEIAGAVGCTTKYVRDILRFAVKNGDLPASALDPIASKEAARRRGAAAARRARVAELRRAGLTAQHIGPALGVNVKTIQHDLRVLAAIDAGVAAALAAGNHDAT